MADNFYKDDSIESLSPREHVRLRPGMYAGDTSDATQLAIEILGNAIDEYNIGHGNIIYIDLLDNSGVVITDEGQGFPINVKREDGETVLQASFDVINTSGKYREDGVYEGTAIGLNGIGAKLTNFLSHKLTVKSSNSNGDYEEIAFIEGVFTGRNVGKDVSLPSGTTVSFQPSEQFFDNPKVNETKLYNFCEDITCLCPGLTIIFNGKEIKHNGIEDFLARSLGNSLPVINSNLIIQEQQGKQKLDLALTYCGKASSVITAYVNCGLTTAGPHITAIKSCITRTLNKWAKEQGLLGTKDKNLEGTALQEGLVLVCNITTEGVAYDAQVKSNVTKIDTSFISSSLGENFEVWLDNNPGDGRLIVEKALVARKAAEAARKAREAIKAKVSAVPTKPKKTIDLPSKLADCYSSDRKQCEIYVVEGDSAGGNLKQVRNNEFQAVFPLRGKMLNTQKASLEKILKNAEIVNLIKAFGLQISSDGKRVVYDYNNIRYGKIIIMSDADVDGAHIKNLFYTFIWNFIPDLIVDGFIYAGIPPLYRLKTNKEILYLKDDDALEEFKETYDINKYQISRLKGLGEMSPEETEEALVNPETRIIEQITIEDTGKADNLFDILMGSSADKRKKYIEEHSEEASIVV